VLGGLAGRLWRVANMLLYNTCYAATLLTYFGAICCCRPTYTACMYFMQRDAWETGAWEHCLRQSTFLCYLNAAVLQRHHSCLLPSALAPWHFNGCDTRGSVLACTAHRPTHAPAACGWTAPLLATTAIQNVDSDWRG